MIRQALGLSPVPRARIAINRRPIRPPWGGGNQWLNQMARALRRWGYAVQFRLDRTGERLWGGQPVDCIIIADPRMAGTTTVGLDEIKAYKICHPQVRCLHRINENDQRKNTDGMDKALAEANALADHTVFISSWLRDYHVERWFDANKPHTVIINGADPRIFHPRGGIEFESNGIMRLVTHHWSDHWMKGFAVYQEIDRLISEGQLPKTELWVIGRWPRAIRWKTARTFPPLPGEPLARLLKQCHVYVTASLWEPGGLHVIEGVQCGLPVLYHRDGGGIVEVGRWVGIEFHDDIRSAILQMRDRYAELRQTVLRYDYSGDHMCEAYRRAIEHTIGVTRPLAADVITVSPCVGPSA